MLNFIQDYTSLEPSNVASSPVFYFGLLLILVLLFLWIVVRKLRTELVSVFEDENGAVQITPQALKELVRKTSAGIDGIHSPTTTLIKKSNQIRLRVRLSVDPECNVNKVRSLLHQSLRMS